MSRSRVLLYGLSLAVLLVAAGPIPPLQALPGGAELAPHVPGEVLIRFVPSASVSDIGAIRGALGAQDLGRFLSGGLHWRLGPGITVEEALDRFRDHPLVHNLEPNYILTADVIPNDPRLNELWGMINTGQTGGTADADIDAELAWNVSTGSSSILVGVIDTGIDYNHPDLAANMWTNPNEVPGNGIDDDSNGYVDDVRGWDFYNNDNDPFDDNSHGTHVSGTIGAIGDNGIGVAGVNWNIKLVGIKFLSSGGSGTTAAAVLSVDYATSLGVRLTSNSWGGGGYSQELYDAISRANAANIAFVAAAGNNYGQNTDVTPHYPSAYDLPNIISVMATDHNDLVANFSNYGPTTVDLGAPGVDVLSSTPAASYGLKSGTSMATPHVSGVCALILAVNPNIPISQMKSVLLNATDPIPALAGKCVSGGRLNAFFAIAEPDVDPPGAIADLATTDPTSNTMGITWTATGDDGAVGTASYTEVRFSTAPIDETSWSAATRAGNEPPPEAAGTPQGMEVRGLTADTLYYFAIKAFDEWGNPGPISNIASGTTLPPPTGQVDPTSVSDDLFTGEQADHYVTLSNVGVGTLDFTIPTPQLSQPYGAPAPPLELGKDEVDPRQGDPVTEDTGGPDAFGYRWIDSDEPGGPVFAWHDISTTGTPISLTSDDQTSTPIALGFNFPFYGTLFDSIRICTNGWLSFTSGSTAYSNQPLPTTGGPENLLALLWDDLHPRTGGRIYFESFGNSAIVQWQNIERYSGAGTYTFQAILDSSGTITYQYLALTGDVASCTVGLQDATKTIGLQVAFNQAYLHDNLAIRFSAIPQWLSASPTSGRLLAGQSKLIRLHMDASGLEGGHYPATVNILTNDPVNPNLPVSVLLHVIGAPDAAVQPASLDYGDRFFGLPHDLTLIVANNGTDTLFVTDIAPSHPELNPQPRTFSVPPHSSQNVTVTWTPALLGPFSGSVTVQSNDAGEPAIVVPCTGNAVPAPVMVVNPTYFDESLYTGNTRTLPLSVRNTGGSDLIVDAAADLGGGVLVSAPDEGATGSGGPDAFGYKWKDSDASGGPVYDFVDISATGTQISFTSSDDALSAAIPMGMTFPFYGNNFTQVKVGTNGFLTFDTTDTATRLTNYNLPSTSGAKNMVALLWDDLHLRTGNVKYKNDGTRFIVQYTNVQKYSPSGYPLTFQVQLYPSGKILYMYQTVAGTLNSLTIGIQDGTKTVGLTAAYNTNYVHNNMAVQFSRTPDWLSVTPNHAVVPPGGEFLFNVKFDSTDRLAGSLHGNVVLNTNIPSQSQELVPATLTVIGAPVVAIVPESFDYGTQFTGYPHTTQFRVLNNGTDVLTVYDIFTTDPTLTVYEPTVDGGQQIPEAEFTLPPGAARLFELRWLPTSPMALVAAVRVVSNDPTRPNALMPVRGLAIPPPVAVWSPASFTENLMVGDVVTRQLHLENQGGSDLNYTVSLRDMSGAAVTVYDELKLGDDEEDPRPGILGSGGPDAFGYKWDDSDELGGPTFDWVDITPVGTLIPFSSYTAGQNLGPYPIGFNFPFYDTTFSQFRVCSNGWISFTSSSTSSSNQPLPNSGSTVPENLLAAFWDTMIHDTGYGSSVYYHFDGARLIVQYNNIRKSGYTTSPFFTFQIILYPNGSIVYQFLSLGAGAPLNSFTMGIQNAAKNDGLTVVFNNASYIHTGLAVRFRALDWLSVTPQSGTLGPGQGTDLQVGIDTTDLIGGDYAARIDINTNDPAHAQVQVPLSMHVTGIPDIASDPSSLTYPMTYVGFSRTNVVTIKNVGTDVLHLTGVEVTGDFSQTGLTPPVSLPVGATLPVTVTFAPTTDGTRTGTLNIASDDPDEGMFVVPLEGFALFPPEIGVDPPAIHTALPPAGTRTKTLTVCNTGLSDLAWTASTNILSAAGASSQNSYLELGKDDIDPRSGILGTGGPDLFGYKWKDSDEPGGPTPAWFDISGVGTQIVFDPSGYKDDGNVGPFPIGFPFKFYGQTFTDFRACTNGWISFTSTVTTYTNQALPNAGSAVPNNLLAAFWDDLVHRNGTGSEPLPSAVYYYNDGSRLIVQYQHMYRIANYTDDINFQIILYPSGRIEYQYETMSVSTVNSHTIGIQNATKDDGLTVVFNDASYIHPNMAIEFATIPEWVKLAPTSGTVAAGACQDVTVTLDATGLLDGIHDADITFTSNDPYTPQLVVPVTLNVGLVTPTWVDFDPDVLNLSSDGNFVTMTVQLTPDLDPYAIPVESVTLNDTIPALTFPPPEYGDRNLDGTTDVRFKFDRLAVEAILPVGQEVPVYIQGEVFDVQWWRGMDTIRTMNPRLTSPVGGEYLLSGSVLPITWGEPVGGNPNYYIVQLSRDGGTTWEELATNVRAVWYDWTVSGALTTNALIRVVAMDNAGVLGYDISDGAFTIAEATLHPPYPIDGRELTVVTDGVTLNAEWKSPATDLAHGPADRFHVMRGASPIALAEVSLVYYTRYSEPLSETAEAVTYYRIIAANAAGQATP